MRSFINPNVKHLGGSNLHYIKSFLNQGYISKEKQSVASET